MMIGKQWVMSQGTDEACTKVRKVTIEVEAESSAATITLYNNVKGIYKKQENNIYSHKP